MTHPSAYDHLRAAASNGTDGLGYDSVVARWLWDAAPTILAVIDALDAGEHAKNCRSWAGEHRTGLYNIEVRCDCAKRLLRPLMERRP